MSSIRKLIFVGVFFFGTMQEAFGGNISGTVRQLDGTAIPNVTITVLNLVNGDQVGIPVTSNAAGSFSVPLPNGVAVSVTFQDGIHENAALIGISGGSTLTNFDIFMPVGDQGCIENLHCRRKCRWLKRCR